MLTNTQHVVQKLCTTSLLKARSAAQSQCAIDNNASSLLASSDLYLCQQGATGATAGGALEQQSSSGHDPAATAGVTTVSVMQGDYLSCPAPYKCS